MIHACSTQTQMKWNDTHMFCPPPGCFQDEEPTAALGADLFHGWQKPLLHQVSL